MNHSSPIRVGAVSYLNTVPLVEQLGDPPEIDLSFDLPSRLADDLANGHLDVALIPCIEFFQNPDYVVVSDACIACRGPVLSVKLISRVPFESIRTVALDEGSRTSVALAKILLRQRFQLAPEFFPLPIAAAPESLPVDAALIIGDRAMHGSAEQASDFVHEWDLGEQWCEWSGLPFVFAMWVARADRDWSEVETALCRARDRGIARLPQIAEEHAANVGLSQDACLHYLRDNLHFYLGPQERKGLRRFRDLSHQFELAPAPELGPYITEPHNSPIG